MLIASQRTELENGARNYKKRSSGYDNSQASNESELELSCCKKEPFAGCINRTNLSLWGTWNKLFMALPVPQLSTACTLHGIHPQNAGTGERCSGERSHWGRADWSRQVSLTQSTAPHSGSKSWGILPGQGSRLQESIAQLGKGNRLKGGEGGGVHTWAHRKRLQEQQSFFQTEAGTCWCRAVMGSKWHPRV